MSPLAQVLVPVARIERPPPPRIWPSLVALTLVLPAAVLVSGLFIALVMLVEGRFASLRNGEAIGRFLDDLGDTPWGVTLLIVPGQLVFLACALIPATLSREPLARRLGLVPARAGPGTIVLVLCGTMGVQGLISIASPLLGEPSEDLMRLWHMLSRPSGIFAAFVVLLFSLMPGCCEELFFRGYVQTRLCRSWPPWIAIGLTSLVFAAAHIDPQHVIAVFPLAIWLGVVAWRSGSVWMSMACHFVNNFVGIVASRCIGEPESGDLPRGAALYVVTGVLCVLGYLGLRALGTTPRSRGL